MADWQVNGTFGPPERKVEYPLINSEKCTLVYLSASTPLFRQGGRFLCRVPSSETENGLKLNLVQTQRTASHTAAGRPPAADRRPPTADRRPPPSSYTPHPSDCPATLVPGALGRAEARATSAGSSGFNVDGNLSIDPACRCQLRSIQPFTFPRFGFVRVLEPQMRHFSHSFRGSAFNKATSQNRVRSIPPKSRCLMARGNFAGARYELDEFYTKCRRRIRR